jgi:hypothetical protein
MKKIIFSMLLLVIGAVISKSYSAPEKYALRIGDVQVSSSNASDIRPTGLTSGKISYDHYNNNLMLEDICFNSSGSDVRDFLNSDIEGMSILVKGFCRVNVDGTAFRFGKRTVLSSPNNYAQLEVRGDTGFYIDNDVIVSAYGLSIRLDADHYPVVGGSPLSAEPTSILDLVCSSLSAYVTDKDWTHGAITNLRGLVLLHVHYANEYNRFDTDKRCVVDNWQGMGVEDKDVKIEGDLVVGNQIINLNNTTNISNYAAGVTSGTITYDKNKHELHFDNVTQSGDIACNVDNYSVDSLILSFSGTNKLTSKELGKSIHSCKHLTLQGESLNDNLTLTGNNAAIVMYDNEHLKISNMTLTASASKDVILGYGAAELFINKASVDLIATNSDGSVVSDLLNCTLYDCDVLSPSDCCFRKSLRGFGNASGLSNKVQIRKVTSYYPVSIFGHQMNNVNTSAFDGLTSGTISYDNSLKKLTLNKVKLESPNKNNKSAIELLASTDIELKGVNSISSTGSCISATGTVNITGTGDMNAVSTENNGVEINHSNAKFKLATSGYFFAEGAKYGYWGMGDDELVLKKETSDGYGYGFKGSSGSIFKVGSLTLDNMDYAKRFKTSRNDYYFDDHAVCMNGGDVVKNDDVFFMSIKEKLDAIVAGKQLCRVQDASYDINVGSPYIISSGSTPTVSYRPDTKTLTLNNSMINYKDNDSNFKTLQNGVDGLQIVLDGHNFIMSKAFSAMWLTNNTTTKIIGNGTLYAKGEKFGAYLGPGNNTLEIADSAQVAFEAEMMYGIGGNNGGKYGEKLSIRGNAAVLAYGPGAVGELKTFSLGKGIKLREPEGATFKRTTDNGYCVYVDGHMSNSALFSNGSSIFDPEEVLGDVNGDGVVTMADANVVVNYFLADETTKAQMIQDGFNVEKADVNGDGSITMADANQIVNIFLNGD